MCILYGLLVVSAVVLKSHAGFVDNLQKCSIKDDKCFMSLYETSLRQYGKVGVPELELPPIDPLRLTNVAMTVLDGININLSEGVIKGISKCEFKSFHLDMEKLISKQKILCDLLLKGSVSFGGSSQTLQSLLGMNSIEGHGKGKVKLEKLSLELAIPFNLVKKDDGEIYIKVLQKNIKYKYDVGKAILVADKIFIGKDNINQLVVPYFNTNWRRLMKNYGKMFADKALEYYFNIRKKSFEGIPASTYMIEDLTPYVKS